MAKNWRQPLANSKQRIEVLSTSVLEEINPANNYMVFEADHSAVKLPDETSVLADIMMAAL